MGTSPKIEVYKNDHTDHSNKPKSISSTSVRLSEKSVSMDSCVISFTYIRRKVFHKQLGNIFPDRLIKLTRR